MARPYTIVFSTMSVDGRIAGETGFSALSCPGDFVLQHELRAWSDAVMVGAGTVLADNPRLTVRLARGRSPARVVVDAELRTSPEARVYQPPGRRILITRAGHGDKLGPFTDRGVEVIEAPLLPGGGLDLAWAMEALAERGVRRLMVEGGGRLNYEMLVQGLVDEVRLTVSPYALGSGVSFLHKPAWRGRHEKEPIAQLALKDVKLVCGTHVHLVYTVIKPRRPAV